MVDTKAVWIEFPGLNGFEVEVAMLSRKELTGLRKNVQQLNLIERRDKQ